VSGAAAARRLIAAILTLAIIDPWVPWWLAGAERARYEGAQVFRFAYSDLFAIGPVVDYLHEHPRGDRPRNVFFGNSVVWGYRLRVGDSLPVQFQQLEPSMRVLNFAVNGFGIGSAYLMLKTVIDSIDVAYVHAEGAAMNPGLPRLFAVSDADIRRFGLDRPDAIEQRLEEALGVWRLYRSSYRLQAAWFGTSTRNFLYANKSALVGSPASDEPPEGYADNPPSSRELSVRHAIAPADTRIDTEALARAQPALWEAASTVRTHGRRAVFWTLANGRPPNPDWDALNRVFAGSAVFAEMTLPPEMMIDERHLTARGSAAVARALSELTRRALPQAGAVH
jgi:hypothetical protein